MILEMFEKRAVLHVIDSDILGIHPHRPGPADPEVRSRPGGDRISAPSRKKEEDTSKETWEWDLKGKQVRFHEQEPSSASSLTYDMSQPTLPSPGENGNWTSTRLLPDLKKLTGATKMTNQGASALQIALRGWSRRVTQAPITERPAGRMDAQESNKQSNRPDRQGLSDTLLFKCPLNGEPPVIRINLGRVGLSSDKSEFVSIENVMFPPPSRHRTIHPESFREHSMNSSTRCSYQPSQRFRRLPCPVRHRLRCRSVLLSTGPVV